MSGHAQLFTFKTLTAEQKLAVMELWNNEYPIQLQYANVSGLDAYLANLKDVTHHLFINDYGKILGWILVFGRDGKRWFAIIIDKIAQGEGLGRVLLNVLRRNETSLCGWVADHNNYILANGDVYRSPLPFYLKLGFKVVEGERLETDKLSLAKIYWEK